MMTAQTTEAIIAPIRNHFNRMADDLSSYSYRTGGSRIQ
jgi:hypothetical protein